MVGAVIVGANLVFAQNRAITKIAPTKPGKEEVLTFEGEWVKDVKIEDLPASYQEVANLVGVENAVKLSEHLGGLPYYFPKIDGLLERKRNEMIRKDRASGMDYRDLAKKYKLTEVWIRQIVDHKEDDKQISLFKTGDSPESTA